MARASTSIEASIHPTAVLVSGAQIGHGVSVGPFCHVGPDVVLGDRVSLIGHVTVLGATTIGEGSTIHPYAALGGPPQNTKHKGGRTTLTIGHDCIIREFVTMHVGTDTARGATEIGSHGHFLAYSHIAHDCVVGDHVTLTNGATLGGHCEIGDNVSVGGLSAVHQFVRVGRNAFLGGGSMIVGDVIPYAIAVGNRARLRGLNIIGLRRQGFPRSEILTMREAYRQIFDPGRPMAEGISIARSRFSTSAPVMEIVDFLSVRGKRHYCVPPLDGDRTEDDDEA